MRRAFTVTELGTSLMACAILAALLVANLAETRRTSQLGESIANLKRFAMLTTSYAADHEDGIWTFTWRGGETYPMMDLNGEIQMVFMNTDLNAASRQAVHIMRANGGRIGPNGMPVIQNWISHPLYLHLVLQAYAGEGLLDRWVVSPADRVRLDWQDDPETKFDQGLWLPLQPDPTSLNRRWPYSSSYDTVSAAWDFYQSDLSDDAVGRRVQQATYHNSWTVPGSASFEQRTFADIAFPGAKVHVHDTHQRHFGPRQAFFGLDEARLPMAMFDASVGVRQSGDANPGWRPNTPTFPCLTFWYRPLAWDPPTLNGEVQETAKGFYRYTRGGLKGVDFGGLPLDTGQPDPGTCDL